MEYWWKENKRFAIPVAIGVIVALLWNHYLIGGMRAEALRLSKNRQAAELHLRNLTRAGIPSEDVVQRAERDTQRARDLVQDLAKDLQLKVPGEYKPPGSSTPEQFFMGHKEDIARRVREKASTLAVHVEEPTLGFDSRPQGLSPEVAEEMLMRLAIVESLAMKAIAANVQRIVKVTPMVNGSEDAATRRPDQFLNRIAVRMRVAGRSKAIFEWLHAMQKRGDGVSIDNFSASRETPHDDVLQAELEVSGLLVNEQGSLTEAKQP